MELKYKNLMSPIKVGKYILKNRLYFTNAIPHFINGPELYPSDGLISYLADVAKNGAAAVPIPFAYKMQDKHSNFNSKRKIPVPDICRFPEFDQEDPSVDNYMSQMIEAVKINGALPYCGVVTPIPEGYNVVSGWLTWDENPDPRQFEEITEELMLETLETVSVEAKSRWDMGIRMYSMHMAYENTLAARFLSSRLNTRKDKYGGSLENRARYPIMLIESVKKYCPDMLLTVMISGEAVGGGMPTEEVVEFAKLAEGKVDILEIRCDTCMNSHPTNLNSTEGDYHTLKYAEALKKSGVNIVIAPVGGFQEPDDMERFIAEGKCDMFGVGRGFITDYEFGQKLMEGRGDDIVPCLRCNKCHCMNMTGPWLTVCSVNPVHGMKKRMDYSFDPAKSKKRVAVIGGGPAGMEAAITACKRGHDVTIYEKNLYLGGQLYHTDYASFKWTLKKFKDYLINQVNKSGITVKLGTEITPDELRAEGYDAVIAAVGAAPVLPPIPGVEGKNVINPLQVYGNENKIGKTVAVIGGSDIATETAIHLAELGHKVTALTRQNKIAPDSDRIHYYEVLAEKLKELDDNLKIVLEATTTAIDSEGAVYTDVEGMVKKVIADTVIATGGMKACTDEAFKYASCSKEYKVAGDCVEVGNIQSTMRTAYSAASML